jgi:phytoene dehydrogenase-like protein
MAEYDYVLVGGGINALVAAAMLGKKRRTTLVLERNAAIGGCLRTEAITAPGFVHDVMATTLVLFRTAPAYQALGKDLEARGSRGLDGVSRAANEAERGLLPAEPTICVGQPTALDPSRAPPGAAILWLQMPEAPRFVKGDAAGEIAAPADGRWSEGTRESYADRIERRLAAHIENWAEIRLARRAYSPADLQEMNINLVGGDPYGGACALDQFFLWRPFKSSVNHRTYIPNVYHIGASTHPGPGLGGVSGFLLASSIR